MVKKNYLSGQSRYEFWRVIKFNEIQVILDFIISKLEELKVEPFIPKDIID
nr:hypothetical protein QOL21_05585 [Acholeplasma laidlawii]